MVLGALGDAFVLRHEVWPVAGRREEKRHRHVFGEVAEGRMGDAQAVGSERVAGGPGREEDGVRRHLSLALPVDVDFGRRALLVDLRRRVVDAGRVAATVGGRHRLVTVVDHSDRPVCRHLDRHVKPGQVAVSTWRTRQHVILMNVGVRTNTLR